MLDKGMVTKSLFYIEKHMKNVQNWYKGFRLNSLFTLSRRFEPNKNKSLLMSYLRLKKHKNLRDRVTYNYHYFILKIYLATPKNIIPIVFLNDGEYATQDQLPNIVLPI